MKNFRFRIQVVFIALLLGFVSMSAQNIRYVKMASAGGDNANNGLSWANAKADIQDAINDLVNNNLVGEVRVMAGTYKPTETTEASTNVQFKAFKIPAGITVRGGYSASGETMSGETILSGNLTGNEATFTFSNGKYNTSFYGNSYHVVWFAMNGFENDRAKALAKAARLENCTVEGGHAYNTSISGRSHTAYGGGIYMVANSYVTNCIVRKCDASRDGGGIYMDGGGEVRHTTVTKCQALGISIDYGFGGGICAEGNNSPYYAIVTQSKINSCVGRMGGGMAFLAQAGANKYHLASNSTLINNNTATTEAGGVYMENGGGLANMTITRNHCNGTGVNANGVEFGRASGVFCHDCGNIGNSVIWGNTRQGTPVQLVAERSANRDDLKTKVRYCALSDIDNTDWSSTIKQGLKSLNSDNSGATSGNKGNALFNNPTTEAGVLEAYTDVDNKKASYAENEYCWNIDSHSAFRHAGIYTIDLDHEGETPAPETSRDLVDNQYNPRTTLGAYSVQGYAVYPKITGAKAEFFIDPNFLFSSTPVTDQTGQSWDNPGRFLANAFEYIKAHKSSELANKEIYVYVKQGTINNTNSNATGRVRLSSIDIPAGVKVYGGYAADLTGTNLSKRNPIKYPSVITGEVTEGEYDYNVAHLVTINGNDVTLDGFKITLANAFSTLLTSVNQDGAAITIKGATGVSIKNIIISNCQASHGAAVYADGATASFENCIFHNNTTKVLANSGIVYGINGSKLSFNHCNVLRSVGHASYLSSDTKNEWTNSMFYGNLDRQQDNTNNADQYAIIAFAGPGANNTNLTGGNNMFDTKTKGQFNIAGNITGADIYNTNGLNYTYQTGTPNGYPRMINPTKNAGISPQGDITYYGRATSFEPHNDNPVVNAASYDGDHTTWGKDITDVVTRDFGGLPDIGAIESHIATVEEDGENANTDGMQPWGAVVYVREYADKNTTHANGTKRDGTSWENAINGNAQYPNNTPTGWTKATDTESVFQGFRIKNGTHYLRFSNNALSAVSEIGQATVFTISGIVDNGNKDGGYTGTITGNHTLSVGNSYIGIRRGSNNIQYSTGVGTYSTLNISASGTTGYTFAGTTPTSGGARYLNLNGTTVRSNSASTVWTLEAVTSVISSTVTGWTRNENTTGTINGLQYAVNQAEKMIEGTGYLYRSTAIKGYKNKSGDTYTLEYRDVKPETVLTQVWVGAGTYTEPKGYELRNHVKVYGAFPKVGTPGMDQRRPQLSSGIQNSTENAGLNYADFETIIQPSNTFNDNTLDEIHTLNHSDECRPTVPVNNTGSAANVPQNHVAYEDVLWDGFTIRHGRIKTEGGRSGGGGVRMFENFTLTNCVVRDNYMYEGSTGGRGCGIYCEDGTVNNCYVMNNKCGATSGKALFGGGIYAISGEIFNSVITGNDISASSNTNGSGIFIEDAKFYNNTIVNNHGSTDCAAVGTYPASAARANLDVYNTIIIGGTNGTERCYKQGDANTPAHFYNCYLQTTVESDFTAKPQIFTNCTNVTDQISTLSLDAANYPFIVNYATATSTNNYRLKDGSLCINAGTEDVGEAVIPDFDMDYAQRVQDCTIDIGAYEYNGAYAIQPHVVGDQAIYYVTPDGYGTASATDPENAACAAKLQKVIDAAGRYKYENPGKQVIVKVANSKALANEGDYFQYYATRTTDPSSTDTRNWSIIIPRGVEVWGGYTDAPVSDKWSNSNNGFYAGTYDNPTDARDILANPTYFASYFYNRDMKINAVSYHVVTFTDRVYDAEGKPYLKDDEIGKPSSFVTTTTLTDADYMRMSDKIEGANVQKDVTVNGSAISARGVLDGIFVTGGKADAVTNGGNVNINGYGGAAIVNEYAHVRNCILTGNSANNGGALALKDMGIVSGCLIVENEAQKGGGIYVFENGTTLSDGTTVNTAQGSGPVMDWRMPHVFTSTIANNTATNQGAGVWFNNSDDPNVRINSSVIWKNETNNDPNIAGNIFPEKPLNNTVSTDEYYPLAYTAVEGQRASGANNKSVNSDNLKGTRFATSETDRTGATIATDVNGLSFYGLTSYSILNNTGMPRRFYESMLNSMALSPKDYAGVHRTESGESTRTYIEIGARAFGKIYPEKGLMLRLYVAQPEDVDMDAAQKMMALSESTDVKEKYYSQEGSSSAYPFQSLQEALNYIYKYRSATQMSTVETSKTLLDKYHANQLPFEIVMSQGVYYPTRDLADKYGRSLANTFPVPEAVSIYGSFAAPEQNGGKFYGAGYQAKASFPTRPDAPTVTDPYFITQNIQSVANETTTVGGVSLNQLSKDKLLNERKQQDNNANGIIEPWEFTNQTILSGNSVNTNNAGVYHVVTAVADQNVVGVLPWISVKHDEADAENCDGLHDHEEGQTIHLNGLQISGGNAYMYDQESLDKYGSYIYYQGGGLQVDGNRYNDDYNKNTTSTTTFDEKHRISYGVGYRDIPLSITKCRFINNRAGYGGAISSNGTLDIFSSSFEANLAIAHTDHGVSNDDHTNIDVMYPGEGGAILATHQLSCFNTVFANNEARFDTGETVTDQPQKHTTFRMPDASALKPILRAAGGAIMMGTAAQHHIVNCDFVRNKAMAYPAVFTMNPTAEPANQDAITTPEYSQILNSVAWGNEIDATVASKYYSAKFMCNVGPKTRPADYSAANLLTADKSTLESSYQEAVWFSAYENDVSFAAHNEKDARDLAYSPIGFAAKQITTAVGTYQNCNIEISSENETLEGPNFGNPSLKAGIDGFMASADWSPARINRLTDAGSGVLKLNADRTGFDMESSENTGAYVVTHFIPQFPEYKENLPLGTERYMNRASNGEDLYRIALDPDKKSDKAYIDMGVYEYRYATLKPSASEVDLLWVATRERGEADGSTWDNATSDLQRAIETLLESRNGHKKEIHIMEGEYSPTKTYTASDSKQYQAFYIDTKQLNGSVEHAPGWQEDTDKSKYYAQSLTIKGGYSNDLKYQYDPKEYPTVIRQQASTSGAKTDYLIYIADPTQRYDLSDYTDTDDGAKPSSESTENTMPIQIDGVTLINDQAPANTKGSAIYYPDVAEAITSPTAVNVNPTVTYYLDAEMQNPAAPGVVTDFFSTRTYYTDAEKQNPSTGNAKTSNYKETGEQKNDPAKLVITKTLVVGSGKSGDTTGSAVYIGKNGGSALIYNAVFHSNYGMPLDAWNTINVNNTFAKNGGLVQLNDQSAVTVESQMFNSALWLNNSNGEQFSIPNVTVTEGNTGKPANFAYNAFTGGNTTATDYTVADGTVAGNNYNTGLVEDNSNILNGPNFVNPGTDADNTVEAFMLRNFDIKPSLRLFNRGMDTSIESGDGHYFKNVVENKYDFSLASTTDVDVINRPRLAGSAIDRGAYEYQGSLKQYLYVDPNKTGDKTDKAGDDWTTPLGYGDIQNAMDLAGLYHANNPEQNGYVFVKGNSSTNKGENTNETITIRDGVTTYGSILSSYTDWHDIKDPNDPSKNKYNNVDDFIRDIRLNREGVASTHANQTIVTGIKTSDATAFNGDNGNTPAIIDGFVVTDPNGPTAPVLDITNESKDATIVVRNIIVADNDMSKAEGNVNVAQISNGLIYEALFRDNKPKGEGAVLKVSNTEKTKGYAVNVTVEGKTVGADGSTPVDGDNESGSQIYKSITNSVDGSQDGAYGKIQNKGIFGYYYNIGRIGDTNKSTNADLNYQLSETSKYIDMCEAVNPLDGVADNLAQFINYQTDRDILGNPRLLAGVTTESKIDRGAFETWKVENDWHTGHDNSIAKQSGYESTTVGTYEDDIKYTFYPHAGSAVYLMEDKYIVLDAPGAGYDETTSNPGFLLVKEGANLYTNGRHTTVAYVAVERKVKEDGSILALPYAMKYGKNVAVVGTDGSDLKLTPTTGSTSLYSGTDRMDWKYVFQKENTKCWKGVAENVAVDACNGILYEPNKGITFDANKEVLLRFTAQGAVINDYIYEEYGPTKEVTLTKHDDAESTNNGADYTDELDMSWNCFGIPYLVSEYKPYEKATAYSASDKYMMNIPHTLWLYYDGMVGPDGENVNGDGGYYSVKSWTSEAADWHVTTDAAKSLWVGEGIFTQTATLDDSESLVFYRPVAPTLGGSESPAKGVRYYFDGTGIEETEDVTGAELVDTEYYTTDGARISRPHRGAIVIVKQVYSDGNIKTSKQYVK